MEQFDTIIIGAGAAGLAAAIYTARKKLSTLVLSASAGGQANMIAHIENYPGVPASTGPDLINNFLGQAQTFGADIRFETVSAIEETEKGGKKFKVKTDSAEYEGKSLILAFGKTPIKLNIPGEKEFTGKGVTYCATCDAPLYKNKKVAVFGSGAHAIEAALLLSRVGASEVNLVFKGDKIAGEAESLAKLAADKKIKQIANSWAMEIKGETVVREVILENQKTKQKSSLQINGIFVEAGAVTDTKLAQHLVKVDKQGQIIVDINTKTSHLGIFAAGDVTQLPYKQLVISAGEGAKAGLEAYKHVTGSAAIIDWKH
ncbi:Ferredoxin--NADP reductase [Candidatus Gugararchaeum adminiculabundum]|nr:Ferredoxin--NADP reductase [Candidatus Gugararchaeum adminiculabundum]